ncbi:unnamed protein product [Prorocentrum cordatum]|uniref:Uncharacterized protein n=1 Tax=Prorocentrum cordatum TaxID=2364126 RepID=A0ABN9XT06_9DINO|nr:unnamed protein product [Polarella glacialis]
MSASINHVPRRCYTHPGHVSLQWGRGISHLLLALRRPSRRKPGADKSAMAASLFFPSSAPAACISDSLPLFPSPPACPASSFTPLGPDAGEEVHKSKVHGAGGSEWTVLRRGGLRDKRLLWTFAHGMGSEALTWEAIEAAAVVGTVEPQVPVVTRPEFFRCALKTVHLVAAELRERSRELDQRIAEERAAMMGTAPGAPLGPDGLPIPRRPPAAYAGPRGSSSREGSASSSGSGSGRSGSGSRSSSRGSHWSLASGPGAADCHARRGGAGTAGGAAAAATGSAAAHAAAAPGVGRARCAPPAADGGPLCAAPAAAPEPRHGLEELFHPEMTHMCATASSRIDRLYLNHHASEQIDRELQAVALEWQRDLSAHRVPSWLPGASQSGSGADAPAAGLPLADQAEDGLGVVMRCIRASEQGSLADTSQCLLRRPLMSSLAADPYDLHGNSTTSPRALREHAVELAQEAAPRLLREAQGDAGEGDALQIRRKRQRGTRLLYKLAPGRSSGVGAIIDERGSVVTGAADVEWVAEDAADQELQGSPHGAVHELQLRPSLRKHMARARVWGRLGLFFLSLPA